MTAKTPLDLIDAAIADLEAKLNLAPGQTLATAATTTTSTSTSTSTGTTTTSASVEEQTPTTANIHKKKKSKQSTKHATNTTPKIDKNPPTNNQENLPDICKLEFKVGKIIKAWVHPDADKLYCEEIDVGEDTPRLIASGLRKHYTLEEMQGRRVVVVSNLKTKKLAGFASSGMVLCAAALDEKHGEKVEFVEPPEGAVIGEVITYQGLPPPQPLSGAQVEKKKIFPACAEGMKTTEEGLAAWNGHLFMTSGGPCTCATICNGAMR